MELKIDEGAGLKFETPTLETLQSYEKEKRRKRRVQKLLVQEVVRRATDVFVGVTLLSLLVTLFTGLSVIHSYTYYAASTFLYPLLPRVLQRKYMFFVCNAILAFLIRCISRSSFYASSTCLEQQGDDVIELVQEGIMPIQDHNDDHQEEYELEADEEEEDKALEVVVTTHPGELDKQVSHHHHHHHVGGVRTDVLMEDEDCDKENEEGRRELERVVGEYDGGGDNNKEKVNNGESTEELNKKIEEFIRKMKRELQLEVVEAHSPQHLIPA